MELGKECMNTPSISARFLPYRENESSWILKKEAQELPKASDGLPIPPKKFWAGYGEKVEDYLLSAKYHFADLVKILEKNHFQINKAERILDFGCAAGRLTRQFKLWTHKAEIWGTDINAEAILWCQKYLSPPFKFVTTTTFPSLPFEDNFFDLIIAGSVFTHIGDLEDTWLMELRRVLRPQGVMYVTVHDNHTIKLILNSKPGNWMYKSSIWYELKSFFEKYKISPDEYEMFMTSRTPGNTQVYHDIGFLRHRWGQYFDIVAIEPEAYGYQTAVILKK